MIRSLKKILIAIAKIWILYTQIFIRTTFPRKPKKIKEYKLLDLNKHKFVVIFASYLRAPDSHTKSLLLALKNKGAYIIYTTNHPKADPEENPQEIIDVFIDNGGQGRDFGQYRTATLYLQRKLNLNTPDKIIYCNDSVFYIERNDDSFINEFLIKDFDLIGTFDNPGSEANRAPWFISSWFFSISSGFFNSKEFNIFFRSYKPINNKTYAIRGGEIALTKAALRYSGKIRAIYNTKYLLELLRNFAKKNGVEAAAAIIPAPMREEYERKFKKSATTPKFIEYIERNIYRFSPTHIFQLLLIQETSFPFIKKDLFWSGNVHYDQLGQLDNIIKHIAQKETASEMKSYFRLRGKPSDAPLRARILMTLGLR